MNALSTAGIVILVLAIVPAHSAEPTPLANNPFNRPSSLVVAGASSADAPDSTIEQLIDLRSTMVGEKITLANVAGRVLRPGDVIGDFELLRVFEDRATFNYNGKAITVLVKPPPDETDD